MIGSHVDGYLNFDTRVDTNGYNRGVKNISNSLGGLRSSLAKVGLAIGAAFSVKAVVDFGKTCISTATDVENAWVGLNSIIIGQGKSFDNAKKFIQEYISDGLVPLKNAVIAYKNLSLRGYNEEQIETVMTAFKNSATYARQSQYTLGDAISTATEGLKNENSIVVDNAGVTKNVAKMWEDYAKSIGASSTSLTKQQKIEAEVAGIIEETKFQMGDAAKYANTYSGQMARLSATFTNLKTKIGNILKVIVGSFLPIINNAISVVGKLADKVNALFNSWGIQTDIVDTLSGVSETANDSTDSLTATADSMDDTAEAAKKLENRLAGFDKLNVLNTSDETTDGNLDNSIIPTAANIITTATNAAQKSVNNLLNSLLDRLKKLLGDFQPIKDLISHIVDNLKLAKNILVSIGTAFKIAWDNNNLGIDVIKSIIDRWDRFQGLLHSIGRTFKEVWDEGSGVRIWTNILNTIKNINNIFGEFYTKLKIAWDKNKTGKKIWKDILGFIGDITELGKDLSKITLDWLVGLDLAPLLKNTEKLMKAFRKLAKTIGNKLKIAYKEVLLPLAKWTIEKIVPTLVEALAKALEVLSSIIDSIPPQVLRAVASGLAGIGTAILVFKTGQVIASGITAVTNAFKIFMGIVNSHPVLAAAGILSGIVGAIITYNQLEWSNSEAGKFAEEIDKIKGSLEESTNGIEDTLRNTLDNLDSIYADNTLIDTYQQQLMDLISKSELTPEEAAKLNTIVKYFSDNVDGFDDTWGKYISISDNGKIELKGDLEEIQKELNNTIDAYQRLANINVISDLYTANTKKKFTAQTELKENQQKLIEQEEKVAKAYEDWMTAFETSAPGMTAKMDTYYDEVDKLEELKTTYNESVAAVNKLTMTNDDLLDVQSVLNGDFSDAAAVMMAYNAGLINMQDVTESEYKSLDNLQKAAEESGKNLVLGVVEGTEAYKGALVTNSNGLASLVLSEFDNTMDMHSPSKEMYKRGGYIVAGVINGVEDNQSKLLRLFNELSDSIKNIFESIPNWFENVFSSAWENVKNVFSKGGEVFNGIKDGILNALKAVINGLIDGINTVIAIPFNGINTALGKIKEIEIAGWKPFEWISTIETPQIPKLATGTVVPANYGEFAAILGDNKREPEIVSPVSAMKQAMREVMAEANMSTNSNSDIHITLKVGDETLTKVVVRASEIYKKRHGGRCIFA